MFLKQLFTAVYRFLISLKLAVLTFILLALLTAVGTFVESKYDQEIATNLIYTSFWMSFVMILLALNLTMVLVDRWPWKKRHLPFVLAHFGILTLMMGFVFTNHFGIDGSLQFEEGETESLISLPDMEIKIYGSYDGEKFSLLYEEEVDFFLIKPSKEKPFRIQAEGQSFQVLKYLPYALGSQNLKPIEKGGAPAVRFHLSGSQADFVEWIEMELGSKTLRQSYGPAQITLTLDEAYQSSSDKELVLFIKGDQIFYSLRGAEKTLLKTGDSFQTGWMDFQFRLLEFFPKAQKEFVFKAVKKSSDKTVKAILVEHEGESVWLGQNSYIRFFKEDRVYALSYLNKTQKLKFDLKLLDFRIKNYQGSDKAKEYESEALILDSEALILDKEPLDNGASNNALLDSESLGDGKVTISMNEPLKYKGWTFYQSSFIAPEGPEDSYRSILSVNYDPGRVLKYIGSSWIVLGVALLFIRRRLSKFLKPK